MTVEVSGDITHHPSATGLSRPDWLTGPVASRLAGLITASGTTRVAALTPSSLIPMVELPQSAADDVPAAFTRARAAQRDWAHRSARERAAVVLRFHDLLLDRQDQVLDLIQWENGKSRKDAFLEVADVALTARYYGRRAPGLLAPRRRRGAFPVLTRTTELRHPKGVVGVISPWNYPLSLAAGDVIAALLAGNAVVHKPDSQTALTALWAVDLMIEAGLPADLWAVVLGSGTDLGEPLLAGADYLMFTGSTATGRWMAGRAGQRLIGCSLELGGKNALLVLDDADLDRAAEGAVRACFASSGQLCISMERIYVPAARERVSGSVPGPGHRDAPGFELRRRPGHGLAHHPSPTGRGHRARAGRPRPRRHGADRRPSAPRPGTVVLRTDGAVRGDRPDVVLRRRDLRPRRLGVPLPGPR